MSRQPILNSYWVIENKFLAGEYPRTPDEKSSKAKIQALIDAGVTSFIDLTEERDNLFPYSYLLAPFKSVGVSYQRFPIRDVSVPESKELTSSILYAIDNMIRDEKIVYVHCWGGVGRTGLIVGCWLVRNGMDGKAALLKLRELWNECPKSSIRKSPDTEEQEKYILNWEEDL